jgi:hypothetical protein
VGDSLACGAEDEDLQTACDAAHYRPTENDYLAYGPLTARALCAEYHLEAISGIGLVRNAGDPSPTSQYPFPFYYPQLLNYQTTPDIVPSQWVPDAVVIFLGGNDFIGSPTPTASQFETGYESFIATFRADYSTAPTLFCLSFWGETMQPYVQDVVSYENNTLGDNKVQFIGLDYPVSYLTGCYSHPTTVGQQMMAGELTAAMENVLGWVTATPTSTPTATKTMTATATLTPSSTVTPTLTPAPTFSPTIIVSPTVTFTTTPTSTPYITSIAISLPYPNPARGVPVQFDVQCPPGSNLAWDVFTTSFRKVTGGSQPLSGNTAITWYLSDKTGGIVANGLYYIRVKVVTGNSTKTQILKVIILR